MNDPAAKSAAWMDLVKALRPNQWTKNAVVLAAFFFAYWDHSQHHLRLAHDLALVCAAAWFFCMVSSGIYLINDVRDIEADRKHPVKRYRPIAAGRVPIPQAWRVAGLLLLGGAGGAVLLSRPFALVLGAYILIQLAYSLVLKRLALVDVFVIAGGFVLRAVSGAVGLNVLISPWLLLCAFLLALFLALCKRRHEKVTMEESSESRQSLEKYDERLLDQLIAIIAAATIVSYSIYTLSASTTSKFGTSRLGFTIPFVIFGVFRYLDLVYRHEKGARPEKILLTDVPLLIDLALYGLCTMLVFLTSGL
jgi:4-hydroxybenzoate polyprenyltransferase